MVAIYKFILFVYLNYIKDDEWHTWTQFGRIVVYPFRIIRSLFVWLFCFIFLPHYWYEGSKLQKDVNNLMLQQEKKLKHGRAN